MTPSEIPEGWALIILNGGPAIAGRVKCEPHWRSLQVCVGSPCRAVTFLPVAKVSAARAVTETEALAFQADHAGVFQPDLTAPRDGHFSRFA